MLHGHHIGLHHHHRRRRHHHIMLNDDDNSSFSYRMITTLVHTEIHKTRLPCTGPVLQLPYSETAAFRCSCQSMTMTVHREFPCYVLKLQL